MPATDAPNRRMFRFFVVLGAAAAALVVYLIAGPVAGVDLTAKPSGGEEQEVQVSAVIVASLVSGLAAWGVLALIERLARPRARTVFTIAATFGLLVSLLGAFGGTTTEAKLALAAMHVAVGVVLIVGLGRSAGDR